MDAAEPTGTLRRLECRRLASGQVQNIKWVISALAPRENRRQVWDGGAGRRAPPRPPSPSGAPCRERTGSQAQRDPRHTKPAAGRRRTRGARRTHAQPQLPLTHARTHSHTHRLSHTYTRTRSHTRSQIHTLTDTHPYGFMAHPDWVRNYTFQSLGLPCCPPLMEVYTSLPHRGIVRRNQII